MSNAAIINPSFAALVIIGLVGWMPSRFEKATPQDKKSRGRDGGTGFWFIGGGDSGGDSGGGGSDGGG